MKILGPLSVIAVSFVLFVTGCGSGSQSFSVLPAGQTFIQTNSANNKLDVLFVINAEPNMSAFQQRLVSSFETFMNIFVEKGFDFKIAVVTSSGYMADPTLVGYDSANEDAADFNDYNGTVHSGDFVLLPLDPLLLTNFAINAKPTKNSAAQDGRSFSSFRQALQTSRPINAGFLRSNSFLAVVIVDNQEDFSGNGRCNGCNVSGRYDAPTLDPVSAYVDFLSIVTGSSGPTARFNVSSMTQSAAPCQGGSNMIRIMELVSLTNGVTGDICQSDFGASMVSMSDQIATLSTQFFLNRIPVASTIVVAVNGVLVPQDATNGWTYNVDANSISFHGSAIPAQGASIGVDYDPVTID